MRAMCQRIAEIESVVLCKEQQLKIIKAADTKIFLFLDVANGGGWYWWYRW